MNLISSEILKFLGEVKTGISSRVSSRVADSLEIEVEPGVYKLLGWQWIFEAYEKGRGPTVNGNKGGKTLQQSLVKFFKSKGLSDKIAVGMSWYSSKKIHEKGTKLFRDGGNKGFLTDFFNESKLNSLSNRIGITWKAEILNEIKTL